MGGGGGETDRQTDRRREEEVSISNLVFYVQSTMTGISEKEEKKEGKKD